MNEAAEPSGSFARAFTSLSLASGVSMAANLVRGKLAALFLGPAGVGVFNQLSLMWNLFQISGSLGAFNGLVQHGTEAMVAKDDLALRRLSSTWWILLTAFSCLLASAGAFASPMISNWLLGDHGAHANLVALMLVSIPFAVSAQVYRALLSAARAIPDLVRAQIISDVGGAIVFAMLVPALGLPGAVLGFATIHVLFYLRTAVSVRKILGAAYVRPKLGGFSWALVRSNVGFGASGIAMIALSNISIILVSRMIIDQLGIGASGIFSNAWRIASVYLGAVTTTAISYYLPTLTRAGSGAQMSRDVNATLRFYLVALPPVMVAIMASGKLLVWLILSSKFARVAPLLLVFVPAELFRVIGETMSVALLARRRVLPYTLLYCTVATVFVVGAILLIPSFGIIGAVAAYAFSTVIHALIYGAAAMIFVGVRLDRKTVMMGIISIGMVIAVSASCYAFPLGITHVLACFLLLVLWFGIGLTNKEYRHLIRDGIRLLWARGATS